jgi:hypothetical protein
MDALEEALVPEKREDPCGEAESEEVPESLCRQTEARVGHDGLRGVEMGDCVHPNQANDEADDDDHEKQQSVPEVRDAARVAVVLGGVGIVLDIEGLGYEGGFDRECERKIAHKGRE